MLKTTTVRTGSGASPAVTSAGADAVSNTQNDQAVEARNYGFNGTTWDRIRAGLKTVQTSLVGFMNNLPFGIYNATRPVAADTNGLPMQIDTEGKQIQLPYARPADMVSGAISSAMTGTTSTLLLAQPAAGLRNYVTSFIISNSHATQGTDLLVQDGNGGTTLMVIPAAANYGGAVITLPTPLRQPTLATALYIQNVTTGSNTKASAVGYVGA